MTRATQEDPALSVIAVLRVIRIFNVHPSIVINAFRFAGYQGMQGLTGFAGQQGFKGEKGFQGAPGLTGLGMNRTYDSYFNI